MLPTFQEESYRDPPFNRRTSAGGVLGQTAVAALIAFAVSSSAQSASCLEDVASVTVMGEATIQKPATHVDIRASFTEIADTASEASDRVERRFSPLLTDLKDRLPSDIEIEADGFSVSPKWHYHNGKRTIEEYSANHRLRLKSIPVESAGQWMREITDANPSRFQLTNYQASPDGNKHPAIEAAVSDARSKAEAMTERLGQSIGPAVCISQVTAPQARPMQVDTMELSASAKSAQREPLSIEAGVVSFSARVEVSFAIASGSE